MLSLVYITANPKDAYPSSTLLGAFMMPEDAVAFKKNHSLKKSLKICMVDAWTDWSAIRTKAGID